MLGVTAFVVFVERAQRRIAVNYAKQYLDPTASAFPGHSSSMKIDPAVKAPRAG